MSGKILIWMVCISFMVGCGSDDDGPAKGEEPVLFGFDDRLEGVWSSVSPRNWGIRITTDNYIEFLVLNTRTGLLQSFFPVKDRIYFSDSLFLFDLENCAISCSLCLISPQDTGVFALREDKLFLPLAEDFSITTGQPDSAFYFESHDIETIIGTPDTSDVTAFLAFFSPGNVFENEFKFGNGVYFETDYRFQVIGEELVFEVTDVRGHCVFSGFGHEGSRFSLVVRLSNYEGPGSYSVIASEDLDHLEDSYYNSGSDDLITPFLPIQGDFEVTDQNGSWASGNFQLYSLDDEGDTVVLFDKGMFSVAVTTK